MQLSIGLGDKQDPGKGFFVGPPEWCLFDGKE